MERLGSRLPAAGSAACSAASAQPTTHYPLLPLLPSTLPPPIVRAVYTRQPTLRPDRADRWLEPAAAHRGSHPSTHYYCPAAARLSSGSIASIFWLLPMRIFYIKCEWREFFCSAAVLFGLRCFWAADDSSCPTADCPPPERNWIGGNELPLESQTSFPLGHSLQKGLDQVGKHAQHAHVQANSPKALS